jgi:hypothetical protein
MLFSPIRSDISTAKRDIFGHVMNSCMSGILVWRAGRGNDEQDTRRGRERELEQTGE